MLDGTFSVGDPGFGIRLFGIPDAYHIILSVSVERKLMLGPLEMHHIRGDDNGRVNAAKHFQYFDILNNRPALAGARGPEQGMLLGL